jgi:hypothetical protein
MKRKNYDDPIKRNQKIIEFSIKNEPKIIAGLTVIIWDIKL